MKLQIARTTLGVIVCLFLGSSLAFAQATRTWVSGVGNDANPCSRTAPCKTFAGAISKTASGGEINALDPGGFGAVTITKPITISGTGVTAGVLVSGTNGIVISLSTPGAVILRSLDIDGLGTGLTGIKVLSANTTVSIDQVIIYGFSTFGVSVEGANDKVSISNSIFFNNVNGGSTAAAVHASSSDAANPSSLSVESSQINGNSIAVQADLNSTIRLTNNAVYDNKTGFACGTGGTLSSAGNNRKANNVGGVIPTCAPTVAVTIQ